MSASLGRSISGLLLGLLAFGLCACGRSDLLVDLPPVADAASDGTVGLDGGSTQDGPPLGMDGAMVADAPIVSRDAPFDALPEPDAMPGSCGTCFGCCQGDTCIALGLETAAACGFNGVVCEPCPSGDSCLKGACIGPQPNCGPANCDGCCEDANHCSTGIAQDSCGFGGHDCQGCGSLNALMACVPQPGGGGNCQPTCNSANCDGCCQGTACLLGKSESSCGTMGAACAACSPGELCNSQGAGGGGICQLPCAPSNCAGCCAGDVCAVGDQNIACGVGGITCADCTTTNTFCVTLGPNPGLCE